MSRTRSHSVLSQSTMLWYKQKPYPTAGYPGYPMGPTSILGSPSRAEAFGTSINRIVCTNKCIEYKLRLRLPNRAPYISSSSCSISPLSHQFFKHSDASMMSSARRFRFGPDPLPLFIDHVLL